jgi:hypothetical protein
MSKKRFELPLTVKSKWLRALRSGEYKRGKGSLKEEVLVKSEYCSTGEFKDTYETRFCCLGVARDCGLTRRHSNGDEFVRSTFLPQKVQKTLARMNDSGDYSFNRIADWIEKNL